MEAINGSRVLWRVTEPRGCPQRSVEQAAGRVVRLQAQRLLDERDGTDDIADGLAIPGSLLKPECGARQVAQFLKEPGDLTMRFTCAPDYLILKRHWPDRSYAKVDLLENGRARAHVT